MNKTRQIKDLLYEQVARIGKAAASPKRLELIELLCQGEKTVETLAREVGLSRSSFAAKFRAQVGLGPMEYLTEIRMKYAANLLRSNTEVPLWDISRRTGYKTESSFARAFKLHFGVSPRAYSESFNGP